MVTDGAVGDPMFSAGGHLGPTSGVLSIGLKEVMQ